MLNSIHRSMTVGARLNLIAALLLIPLMMFAGLFVVASMGDIRFAQTEMDGAHYITAAETQFDGVDPATAAAADAARAKYDPLFNTSEASAKFFSEQNPQARRAAGRAFFTAVADASNLTLDPDLDSYYVMDVVVSRIPALHDAISQLQESPADNIAARAVALDRVQAAKDALSGSVAAAIAGNADGKTSEALKAPEAALAKTVAEVIAKAERGEPFDEAQFDEKANNLWRASASELDRLLGARIGRLEFNLIAWLGASIAVLLVAVWLILNISKAMAGRIRDLVQSMELLAKDDPKVDIPCQDDRNETGQIALALNTFKTGLIERLRLQAEAAVSHETTAAKLREMERRHIEATEHLSIVVARVKEGLSNLHDGNFAFRIHEPFPAEYESIRVELNQSAAQLQQLRDTTATMHEETAQKLREMEERHAEATKELTYVIKYVKEGLTKLYEGDLVYRLEEYFPYDFKSIRMDFNQAAAKLQEAMASILHGAQSMNATAGNISSSADQLSQRTEQQAAGLEQTAAALEQITTTIKNNAANAKRVRDVAAAAGEDASAGSHVLRNTRDAMSKIESSSNEVARILGVIDEIAFQTNLLALNAGVEAARAGDSGRGFAVVATEVRALAQRSSEAATEIKSLINASGQDVEQGVALVEQTYEALERIAKRVSEITTLVSAAAVSAEEEARAVAEVNLAIAQLDRITQENAAMVEENTAASHTLAQESKTLFNQVRLFKTGDAPAASTALRRAI